ncbi:hypothetical protein F5141DRAFT_1212583 [Pisolithus sp. B1]|nr:hypothetical protein F5141DRAFT_1212583 [Pisolithus sp. B1]
MSSMLFGDSRGWLQLASVFSTPRKSTKSLLAVSSPLPPVIPNLIRLLSGRNPNLVSGPAVLTVLALSPLISSVIIIDPVIVLSPPTTLGELGTPFPEPRQVGVSDVE